MDRVLIALTRDRLNKFTSSCEGITITVRSRIADDWRTLIRFVFVNYIILSYDFTKMVYKTGQFIMKGDLQYCFRSTCTFVFIFVWCRQELETAHLENSSETMYPYCCKDIYDQHLLIIFHKLKLKEN